VTTELNPLCIAAGIFAVAVLPDLIVNVLLLELSATPGSPVYVSFAFSQESPVHAPEFFTQHLKKRFLPQQIEIAFPFQEWPHVCTGAFPVERLEPFADLSPPGRFRHDGAFPASLCQGSVQQR
jgi:hypothetical protein